MIALLSVFWAAIAAAIVLCLPGLAWIAWFPGSEKDAFERLAEAIGLSLGLTALVGLASFLLGLRFSGAGLVALYVLLALLAFLGLAKRRRRKTPAGFMENAPGRLPEPAGPGGQPVERGVGGGSPGTMEPPQTGLSRFWEAFRPGKKLKFAILLVVFAALLGWRFYQVRTLVLPAWVDSVHHVLIVRVLLETGGIPSTLDPYLPVPFYYHFAFHILAAVFSFFAGLPPEQAVLLIGQVLNAAVALSIYRLGTVVWPDWRKPVLAVLLAGFVSQMPAYYATWGRYTLLTGLVILPMAMAVSLEVVQRGVTRTRLAQLLALTGGLLLAHYFAAMLLALFLVLLGIQAFTQDWRRGNPWGNGRALPLAGAALGGALLAAPWIYRAWFYTRGSLTIGTVKPTLEAVEQAYFPDYPEYLWYLLGPDRNHLLVYLAPLGLVVALWSSRSRIFALWATLLGLISLPWGPHLTPFRPDHAVIVLFFPVTLLVAGLFVALNDGLLMIARRFMNRLAWAAAFPVGVAVAGLFAWGLQGTHSIINESTVLASQADLRALEWIGLHSPPQARFFINVTPWQYGLYRGVDGGWWITPLTGRDTLLPPALYSAGEAEYIDQVNSLAGQAGQVADCSPGFWELVRVSGMTHLYLGEKFGPLRPEGLKGCDHVQLIYSEEGVSIYEIAN